jgi:hypothetical protein
VAELLQGLQSTREASHHDRLVVEEWALSLARGTPRYGHTAASASWRLRPMQPTAPFSASGPQRRRLKSESTRA